MPPRKVVTKMTKARDLASFNSAGVLTSTSSLDATKLTGTIPNGRYGTPTFSASNLTNLPAGGGIFGDIAFSAKRSGGLSVAHNTATTVPFNSQVFDTHNAYNTTTGIFTVPSGGAGKYLVSCSVHYTDGQGNMTKQELYLQRGSSSELLARVDIASNTALMTNEVQTWSGIVTAATVGEQFKINVKTQTGDSSGTDIVGGIATNFYMIQIN